MMKPTNKKGQVGLDIARNVILVLLVVVVLGFSTVVILANLSGSDVSKTTGNGRIISEVIGTVITEDSTNLAKQGEVVDCVATIIEAYNVTNSVLIPSVDITTSECTIAYAGATGTGTGNNNSLWNVSYTFTYNTFAPTAQNISAGLSSFFSNATTWFSLLAVIVIIMIISIVILAVNRFGSGGSGGGSSRRAKL